jgi:hypothetical protein
MKNIRYVALGFLSIASFLCKAQDKGRAQSHAAYYPIGEDPNLSYRTSMVKYETILFEANPIVRYSLFNNMYKFVNTSGSKENHKEAWYVSYRPQLRMYTDNSLPVRTPSYRILLGTQHFWRVRDRDLIGFSLESGHYSNGQDGGAFTDKYPDGSPESEAIYKTITPATDLSAILNRKSANFSTDLTELIFNYRWNRLDERIDNSPLRTHSFKVGMVLYHDRFLGIGNFGGYSDNDIKLYGRLRTTIGYQFIKTLKCNWRFSLAENIETIYNAHPSVQPWRLETVGTVYPFPKMTDLGIFATFVWGHDNYNYRFVDSGSQFGLGISWNLFPPMPVHGLPR